MICGFVTHSTDDLNRLGSKVVSDSPISVCIKVKCTLINFASSNVFPLPGNSVMLGLILFEIMIYVWVM